MTNTISAYIDENANLITDESAGFAGEHNAEMIVIDLGDFSQAGFDYYVVNYSTGVIGGDNSSEKISSADDRPAYISENKIYFPLETKHTCTGRLSFQLDAYKNSNETQVLKKTSVATVKFKRTLVGGLAGANSLPLLMKLSQLEEELANLRQMCNDELAKLKETCGDDLETTEKRLQNNISLVTDKHSSDMKAIVDEFAKVEKKHGDDVDALNAKIDENSVIPPASKDALGGFRIGLGSFVYLDEENCLQPDYTGLNPFALSAMVTTSMVARSSGESFVFASAQEAEEVVLSLCEQLMSMFNGYYVYCIINPGKYKYYNMNYDEIEVDAEPCSVHVIKKQNDEITVEQYTYDELRTLLTEGVVLE